PEVRRSGAKIKRGAALQLLDSFILLFALEEVAADQPLHESGASDRNGKSTGKPGKALKRFLTPVNCLRQQGRPLFHVSESRPHCKPFSIPPHHPSLI